MRWETGKSSFRRLCWRASPVCARFWLNIGWNQDNSGGLGDAIGVLDATQGTAIFDIDELHIGLTAGGPASGTLRWDQPLPLLARVLYLGRGMNVTSELDIPVGGTCLLGTPTDPIEFFRLARLDASFGGAAGLLQSDLDLTVNDPTFEAYVGTELVIGHKYTATGEDVAMASLTLGSNSLLHVGTPTPANLYIGRNQDNRWEETER